MDHIFAKLADNAPPWILAFVAVLWIFMNKGPKWIATISKCLLDHRQFNREAKLSYEMIQIEHITRLNAKKSNNSAKKQEPAPLNLEYDLFEIETKFESSGESEPSDEADAADRADRPDAPDGA